MDKIEVFDGPHAFLSNFFEHAIEFKGIRYRTLENAYQAQKVGEALRPMFITCTPGQAKRLGNKLRTVPDWNRKKVGLMSALLMIKFDDPVMERLLLSTGDAELVEGNSWGDQYWGVCDGVGQNILGQLLMAIRLQKQLGA